MHVYPDISLVKEYLPARKAAQNVEKNLDPYGDGKHECNELFFIWR